MTALIFSIVIGGLFLSDNKDFFETAIKEMQQGATWHYVGSSPLDPTAKSIPGQICEEYGTCGEKYILWKLKK
tara:strand:- start:3889 stop:4107 length:219 start_codon:yes stop_codon:yes gene_type:complete